MFIRMQKYNNNTLYFPPLHVYCIKPTNHYPYTIASTAYSHNIPLRLTALTPSN